MTPGDALPPQAYRVTRADLLRYAEASGDHNPIHSDEAVARSVGLPGVIAHGMYTMALAARAVACWTDGAEVVQFGGRFTHPVLVPEGEGAEVQVAGTVKSVDGPLTTITVEVTSNGQKVLGMTRAVIRG